MLLTLTDVTPSIEAYYNFVKRLEVYWNAKAENAVYSETLLVFVSVLAMVFRLIL